VATGGLSRRRLIGWLAGGAAGGALARLHLASASPRQCRGGGHCKVDHDCCSHACCDGRCCPPGEVCCHGRCQPGGVICLCPPGTTLCHDRCVKCRDGQLPDPRTCKCVCPPNPDCQKPRIIDPRTCRCVCPGIDCSPPHVFDPKTCACVCPTFPLCAGGKTKDPVTCDCVCPPGTTTCPEECLSCPDGQIVVDCQCVCPNGTFLCGEICCCVNGQCSIGPSGGDCCGGKDCACGSGVADLLSWSVL
jgi:hypothetical protein